MNQIYQLAKELKLANIKNNYETLIDEATINNFSYQKFLEEILISEYNLRESNSVNTRVKNAKFPYIKDFESLDTSVFKPEILRKINELKTLEFINQGRNAIFIGNPGIGKTHISLALGYLACSARKTVLYITVPNLVIELKEAYSANQLNNYKKKFVNYDLVILDEVGYISFDKVGSELLFNLLSQRSYNKSIIITTNLEFNKWTELFSDPIITTALVDRITHKAHILNIVGDSYRVKETIAINSTIEGLN